ncbi:V-type ATP synthase subunit E [uncultured Lamprocystis sp.]|jgi:V/A-type H+-transporting ATPase subunit E|uniref:V-type ATP synthase subunit E n=1 Tax=uncultured Lamprocystis sp. TaxID=543132 RepID=UPI0025D42DCB|nr:V-type ATP synthase subunit E family protein [uncultured Lamprocystis sp.]
MNQVQELEQAILTRAERLAAEFRERGTRSRDSILREAAERLRLREAREEAIAKTLAERTFRQHVQASELKMQSQLDLMRWNLVQDVERQLQERMRHFIADAGAYGAWLQQLVAGAATLIEHPQINVSANSADHKHLRSCWDGITQALAQTRTLRLADDPIDTLGGVLLTSGDGRIRVDQTFDGRLARLRPRIQQVILERLLPGGVETGNLFSG